MAIAVENVCGLSVVRNICAADTEAPAFLCRRAAEPVRRFHESLGGYAPTPLLSLPGLAAKLGLGAVFVKDESGRFGLKAFKGLGGSYAVFRSACERTGLDYEKTTQEELRRPDIREKLAGVEFVTATDGNHGKGVAWAASGLGCRAHVYMPRGSVPARAEAIRAAGAYEVEITDFCYDDAVRYAAEKAEKNGWVLVQDTSWQGYEKVPSWIMQGYTTMTYEAIEQLCAAGYERPTHVFLQAGVGALAGSLAGALKSEYGEAMPRVSIAEPEAAACLFESARQSDGLPHAAAGSGRTIMAGLNCGEPCTIAWPILRDLACEFFACPDSVAAEGMRMLAAPCRGDPRIVSGESGALTAGLLSRITASRGAGSLRDRMGLGKDAVVLLFSTEGDTDPENYKEIIGNKNRAE